LFCTFFILHILKNRKTDFAGGHMEHFINDEFLGSFVGCVAVVTAVTQILKYFLPIKDPKWYALGASLLIILLANVIIPGNYSLSNLLISLLNVLITAGTAVGLFEYTVKPAERARLNKKNQK